MSTKSFSTAPGNNQKQSSIAKQAVAIPIALLLAWLAFRGANLPSVITYARSANLIYIGPLFLSVLASHLMRAWRWTVLLQPLKSEKISPWHSFCAVMYGYAVNIVVPRGGEITRLIFICKEEELPWAGVLPTLLIDRLLDLIILALLFGFTVMTLPPAQLTKFPWLYPSGISLTLSTLIFFILLPVLPSIISYVLAIPQIARLIRPSLIEKIKSLLVQFEQGSQCLKNPLAYPLIAFLSLAIWFFYWLNFYIVLTAFSVNNSLTLNNNLIAFTVSSLGALVPTPGCVGGFHFLVSQALIHVGGINQNLALAIATLLHAFCFIFFVVIIAGTCFIWENLRKHPGNKDKSGQTVQQF